MGIAVLGFAGFMFLFYEQVAVGLVWVYKAWSWLSWDQRDTKRWRAGSPPLRPAKLH